MSNSIQNKTIRPGSLKGYAYYYSNRRPPAAKQAVAKSPRRHRHWFAKGLLGLLILAGLIGLPLLRNGDEPVKQSNTQPTSASPRQPANSNAVASLVKPGNHCAGNTHDKFIKISISQRHLWACEKDRAVHQTPVISGLQHHPETETPLGTYKIYGKMTNTTLKGTDSRGSWSYGVYYWMPFLDNQYGTYGFHDATWRAEDAFGNIAPDSQEASHGCVELPLTSQKWLYEWAPVHTVVTVEA